MKTWQEAAADARFSGGGAAAGSLAMLALCGRRSIGSAVAPINAPSHIVWGEVALRKNRPSLRYTLPGAALHVGSALFWGVLYEKFFAPPASAGAAAALGRAGVATAGVALVDLALVPERLTPGFQRRLSTAGLMLVYGAFALGLAAGGCAAAQRRQKSSAARVPLDQQELAPLGPFPSPGERERPSAQRAAA